MLWLTGIATPLCLGGALLVPGTPFAWVLVALGALPILPACVGFAYFARKHPEKLQSEDYQLRHETLQLIQAKTGYISVDPTSIAAIANPAHAALPPGSEGAR